MVWTTIPHPLIEDFKQDRLILFAGAGISAGSGLSTGSALADYLEKKLLEDGVKYAPTHRLDEAATAYEGVYGRAQLMADLAKIFKGRHPKPNDALRLAVELFRQIVTTNFDDLFERAAHDQGRDPMTFVRESDFAKLRYLELTDSIIVHKLHGDINASERMVIAEKDYIDLDRDPAIQTWLSATLLQKKVVFVGYGLGDPELLRALVFCQRTLGALMDRADAVIPGVAEGNPLSARLAQYNVHVISEAVVTFLQGLKSRADTDHGAEKPFRGPRVLRILVVSPGDVNPEREVMRRVIEELKPIAAERSLRLELVMWETDTFPCFNRGGPQAQIDSGLRVEDSDVLIGICWKRFGTPVRDAGSGTAHEFQPAYEAWKRRGRPHIMVCFNEKGYSPKSKEELDQWARVLEFKKEFPKEGLWWAYRGKTEFEGLVRRHLTRLILHHRERSSRRRTFELRRPAWPERISWVRCSLTCLMNPWVTSRRRAKTWNIGSTTPRVQPPGPTSVADVIVLGIALVVTLGMNVDTFRITNALWMDGNLRASLAAQAEAFRRANSTTGLPDTQKALSQAHGQMQLSELPLGWHSWADFCSALSRARTLLGLLLSVVAISLGAPFWFDMLNKIANLRASGKPPGS